jgi:hypothetical protein
MPHGVCVNVSPNGGFPMSDDKTLRDLYRLLATGGPSPTLDDALQRAATAVARRRRITRQFAIPATVAAGAILLTLGGTLTKVLLPSRVAPPLASALGCEEASPRIYPTLSARTDFEEQGTSSAFTRNGAGADSALATFGCSQQRENP